MCTFLKHLDLSNLPISKSDNFSVPCSHVEQTKTVIRSLLFLPPLQGSPFVFNVLSGRHFQNKPVSSALKMSSGWNSPSRAGNFVPSQYEVMSCVTKAASPDIWQNAITCLALNCLSQPELQTNFGCLSDVANSRAFICRIGPDTGTFKLLACLNHSRQASSMSVHVCCCSQPLPFWQVT